MAFGFGDAPLKKIGFALDIIWAKNMQGEPPKR